MEQNRHFFSYKSTLSEIVQNRHFFGNFSVLAIFLKFLKPKMCRFLMFGFDTVLKSHFWKSRWIFGFNQKPTDIESEILNLKSSKSVGFRLKPKVHQKWKLLKKQAKTVEFENIQDLAWGSWYCDSCEPCWIFDKR